MKKTFHLIGAGRVGQTIATLLQQSPHTLSHIVSRSMPSEHTDARIVVRNIDQLPPADALLVCTPDNVIESAAKQIARLPWLGTQTTVIHFSGAKTIAALSQAAARGAATGCLHPVFAFADVGHAVTHLRGNLCALEADGEQSRQMLHLLAQILELQAFILPSEHKARYHAALSAASNFSVTLAAYAQNVLTPLNLPETLSRRLVIGLMQQSVTNLTYLPPVQALTGPIVRGDDATVAAHLAALTPAEQQFYLACAQATLALAAARLDTDSMQNLATLLGADD